MLGTHSFAVRGGCFVLSRCEMLGTHSFAVPWAMGDRTWGCFGLSRFAMLGTHSFAVQGLSCLAMLGTHSFEVRGDCFGWQPLAAVEYWVNLRCGTTVRVVSVAP
jgi:hypothetical protein